MKRSLTSADADTSISKRTKTDSESLPTEGTAASDGDAKSTSDPNAAEMDSRVGSKPSTANKTSDSSTLNSEKVNSDWDFWAKKKPVPKFSGGLFSKDDISNMFKGGSVFDKEASSTSSCNFLGSWPDNGLLKIVKNKEEQEEEKNAKESFTGEVDPGDRTDEVLSEWSEVKVYELCEDNSSLEKSNMTSNPSWQPLGFEDRASNGKTETGSGKTETESGKTETESGKTETESRKTETETEVSCTEDKAEKKKGEHEEAKTVKKTKWVERGEGCLKITKHTSEEKTRYRIICRRSQTLQVLINETITELTEFTRSGNFIRLSSPANSGDVKFFLLKPAKVKLPPLLNSLNKTKSNLTAAA